MAERTAEEIEQIYIEADSYVFIVNTNAGAEPISEANKSQIKYGVEKLEEIKTYKKEDNTTSIWTDQDFTSIDAAIIFGKTLYEAE